MKDGQALAKELESTVKAAQPTITNLNSSSAHLRRLMAALDNPKTLQQLQATVSNAEQLTAKWNAVGGDVTKLTDDPRFMDGIRSMAVGLGKFFEELYPAQTGVARDKAARTQAPTPR
jgi:phospholipid/cholesterol/gamma-HCH transport system substrate-binding protein